ncbi:MAG TPA: hypothetical protein VMX75_06330 [Spirochaetia bacterium]|nr:hypothetical protein [Spirochaetia bacterium]
MSACFDAGRDYLVISVGVSEIKRATFTFAHRVVRTGDKRVLVQGNRQMAV